MKITFGSDLEQTGDRPVSCCGFSAGVTGERGVFAISTLRHAD